MRIFRRRSLPGSDQDSLKEHLGRTPRVLAWATAPDGVIVALPDRLMRRSEGQWSQVPWHDILKGGWNGPERSLRWTRMSTGEQVVVPLDDPGSLPEVFRERVESTFLFQQVIYPHPGRAVTIAARRNLGDTTEPVVWTAHPSLGVRMDDAETYAFVQAELTRFRAEYAF